MTDIQYYSDFKTLRYAYLEVKSFIEKESSETVASLNTKIEGDLGMAGDDNLELLEKFVKTYKLNADGFDYSKHFLSEGELFNSQTALIGLVTLPIYISIWIIKFITFRRIDLSDKKILPGFERKTSDLTFGDMLVWRLTRSYNLRDNVRVVLRPDDNMGLT